MTIYCKNTLEIRGSKYQLDTCIKRISGNNGVLDFENIFPTPDEFEIIPPELQGNPCSARDQFYMLDSFVSQSLKGRRKDKFSQWELQNWGVFGNAHDPKLSWKTYRNKPSVEIDFLTNLKSPRKIVEKLSAQFPLLNFVLHSEEYSFDIDETYRFTNGKLSQMTFKYKR